ncbi:MAG: FtsX-like permease family protein [Longimicrobiales bacterium]|nr:FtsX-like permease family protein [Longimicrobiales bacterium]
MLYAPYQGDPRGTQGLYVRVRGEPMEHAATVRDAIWSVDSSEPIEGIAPMSDLVEAWVAIPRASRALVMALASLAWLLSVVGLFGVVAYAVRTRRTELGIRLALGAYPSRLEADQVRAVAPVVAVGMSAGLALGMIGGRLAGALLHGVSPLDPLSVAGALVAMGGATALATYLPARRAGRVDLREIILVE